MEEGFAGLPAASTEAPSSSADPVPFREFTLPAKHLSKKFASVGFGVKDATYRMVELDSRSQDIAAKLAAGNGSVLSRELIFASISHIGGKPVRGNRDMLDRWWEAVGPKAKRLIEAGFMDMQSVGEADVASFLASGTEGLG
jgi:hypothetical protein